jgi:REP element-mobilizing transposase RayT
MTMIHNRHSLRLKEYDYTQPGPYFVTTVTHGRENLFGNVLDGQIQLNEFGQIVADAWQTHPYRVATCRYRWQD